MGHEVDKSGSSNDVSELLNAILSALAEDVKLLREVWVQLLWTVISVMFPVFAVYFLSKTCEHKDWLHSGNVPVSAYLFGLFYVLTFSVQTISYWVNVTQSFKESERSLAFLRILVAYFSVIVSFAAVYFAICVYFDAEDAAARWRFYTGQILAVGQVIKPWPYGDDLRAFRGMRLRLFSNIDWYSFRTDPYYVTDDRSVTSLDELTCLAKIANNNGEKIVKLQSNTLSRIFWRCLYFSVMTTTTLGGDLVPLNGAVKLFACLQVLFGVVLFVLALGVLFGNGSTTVLRPAGRMTVWTLLVFNLFASVIYSPTWGSAILPLVYVISLVFAFAIYSARSASSRLKT